MKVSIVKTAPEVEPFTLEEAKAFLKIDPAFTDDDAYITRLIKSAREYCENKTNRSLLQQVRVQYQDDFYQNRCKSNGSNIELLKGPLLGVSEVYIVSIKYYDDSDTLVTLDSSEYWVDFVSYIPRVTVKNSWPTVKSRPNAVQIEYNAGYGNDADSIPGFLMDAMNMYISHCYENRVPEVVGSGVSRIELAIESLLSNGIAYQNAF